MKTLIYGGRVIDPANRVDGLLNILVEDGKVAWVGTDKPAADREIDATGKIVSPGFIDIHMHEDPIGEDGKLQPCISETMLRMGVTTALGGNCGINYHDPVDFLKIVDRDGAPVNMAMLAGHEYFRKAAGAEDIYGHATEEQKQEMAENIRNALEQGCLGVSFGLRYVPGADQDEFFRAAKPPKSSLLPMCGTMRTASSVPLKNSVLPVWNISCRFRFPTSVPWAVSARWKMCCGWWTATG